MNFLLFLGTIRDSAPPNPPRLGLRVARACMQFFRDTLPEHSIELIDPLDQHFGEVFKPHFSYQRDQTPEALQSLAERIAAADGYIMVSPEYNHSMSPALAHMLNHFGSSQYGYKPSSIVTYSAGQWGGVRAAVTMRAFLSELGCLPVSAMIHVPKAQEVFSEDGNTLEGIDHDRWAGYFGRALLQLYWWADAAKTQRDRINPHKLVQDFKRDPSQRNSPGG